MSDPASPQPAPAGGASVGRSRAQSTVDRDQLRRRVASIYEAYAPEKLGTVENVLEKHGDAPNALMRSLTTKYGPEPGTPGGPQVYGGAGGSGGAAAASPSPVAYRDASSPSRTVVFDAPAAASAAGSPGRSHSFSGFGGAGYSSGGEDAEFSHLRRMVNESGFLTEEHATRWEEAWKGSIPLATICKKINDVIIEAYGYKRTATKGVFGNKWQRRFFVVISPFVYYFEKDETTSPCRGAIYLPRAEVAQIEVDSRPAIEVRTCVLRKPESKDSTQDYAGFVICFDTQRQQDMWMEVLKRLATITVRKEQERRRGASRVGGPPAAAAGGGVDYGPRSPRGDYYNNTRAPVAVAAAAPASPNAAANGASATKPTELPVKRDELYARIRRLAAGKDPRQVLDVVLGFVEAEVKDGLQLWRLMDSIEQLEAAAPQQPQQQQPLVHATSSQSFSNEDLIRAASIVLQQQQQQQQHSQQQPRSGPADDASAKQDLLMSSSFASPLAVRAPPPTPAVGSRMAANNAVVDALLNDDDASGTVEAPPYLQQTSRQQQPSGSSVGGNRQTQNDLTNDQVEQIRAAQADMQRQMSEMAALMRQSSGVMMGGGLSASNSFAGLGSPSGSPKYAARTDPQADFATAHQYANSPARIPPSGGRGGSRYGAASTDLNDNSLAVSPMPTTTAMTADDYSGLGPRAGSAGSLAAARSQQRLDPYDAPPEHAADDGGAAGSTQMQQRLERMRSRKKLLDDMMRDLPQ